eukprot:TRINITY_DN61859_c0_g1_i1.p1 TRINITY_DN61859_c0_g1~~TRINITY_DN61859_c0_g1_i1.p1  ORF type:complete len:437 (+),score=92.31 TRINITY_DN61859_c0_g1_i1:96-1313(+)
MHHLAVPTTRALSLVISGSEHVTRPWYSQNEGGEQVERHGGDIMQQERCAMTTRVSPSFLRVGHFDLFGRRARTGDKVGLQQLEQLARHALFRDYPHLAEPGLPLQMQVLNMADEVAKRFANLSAEWIRVGYVQSNFNSDNCLVSGLTLDYGPFGFVEKYDPKWGMWIHAGEHFAFMNQPNAGRQNFKTFAVSLLPLLDEDGKKELMAIWENYPNLVKEALSRMWARKLGLPPTLAIQAEELWNELDPLIQTHPTDWTIFWRQLAEIPLAVLSLQASGDTKRSESEEALQEILKYLEPAFYEALPALARQEWLAWLRHWLESLRDADRSFEEVSEAMKLASPKYVPRETMLVEAYEAAYRGDHAPMRSLQELFRRPYDEQLSFGERYYVRRSSVAESQGGVGFMS